MGRGARRIAAVGRSAAALVLLFGLAVVVAACGGSGQHPPKRSAPRPHASTTVSTPVGRIAVHDLSWRSADAGWALAATEDCRTGSCARLLHTTDGGQHWQAVPIPAADLADGLYDCQQRVCVSRVSFATARIGYLYGPALLMTTDGGRSWRAQPGLQVETLSVLGRNVYRVAYQHAGCPGPCRPVLQESRIGSTDWRTLIGKLTTPGRSGSAQIVGSGATVLLASYGSQAGPVSAQAVVYRSSNAGTSWEQRSDPCSGRGPKRAGEEDLIALAAAPQGTLAGLCTPHIGTPSAFVVTSTDGGATWTVAGVLPPVQYPALLAAASNSTLAVSTGPTGGSGHFTARLLISTDAGRSWHEAATEPQQLGPAGAPAWLGFQTPMIGRWIGDPTGIWATHDGGARWTRTALR
jgi:photosystem II stability/assembly factor-like uncharacterized protein